MPLFEHAKICPLEEYLSSQVEALEADQLQVDELYTLMLSVRRPHETRAVKLPTRLTKLNPGQEGYRVTVDMVDDDLQPVFDIVGRLAVASFTTPETITVRGHKETVKTAPSGFFKSYEDGFGADDLFALMKMNQEFNLTSQR